MHSHLYTHYRKLNRNMHVLCNSVFSKFVCKSMMATQRSGSAQTTLIRGLTDKEGTRIRTGGQ